MTNGNEITTNEDVVVAPARFGDHEHSINVNEETGVRSFAMTSSDGNMVVEVGPESNGKVFARNGKQISVKDGTLRHHERWLVGELDGVRAYWDGTTVILTKRDVYL